MAADDQQLLDLAHLDVEARDSRGWTNVHIAVHNNRPEVLDFLLRNGARVQVRNDNDETPLHFAASLDSQPIACTLLKRLPRSQVRQFVDVKTRDRGSSALHVAAAKGAFGIVWLLLSYGANFEIENHAGKRPADVTRDPRIERMLKCAELDSRFARRSFAGLRARLQAHPFFELDASLHSRNAEGWTILQLAVMNGDVEVVESVVQLRSNKEKDEPPPIELLMCLSRLGQCCDDMKRQLNGLLRMCDEEAADLEPRVVLDEGVRLLGTAMKVTRLYPGEQQHLAVIDETIEVLEFDEDEAKRDENARFYVKLFTDNKAELYAFLDVLKLTIGAPMALLLNLVCQTYLGSTAQKYDLTTSPAEKSIDLDLNKQDANGWTPLHYAVHAEREEMVRALLELKSDATLVTRKNRKTPLHSAAKAGNARIVELLLRHVKVPGYVDEPSEPKGLTALHLAAKAGRLDVVKCLLRGGATFCVGDKKDRTPGDLARDAGVVEFLKLVRVLFDEADSGDAGVVEKLRCLEREDLRAVGNARNAEGSRLLSVARAKCESDVYAELAGILSDVVEDSERAVEEK